MVECLQTFPHTVFVEKVYTYTLIFLYQITASLMYVRSITEAHKCGSVLCFQVHIYHI